MTPTKHSAVVDSLLRVAKMTTHTNKQLTTDQWVDEIKSIFDFCGKEEELKEREKSSCNRLKTC